MTTMVSTRMSGGVTFENAAALIDPELVYTGRADGLPVLKKAAACQSTALVRAIQPVSGGRSDLTAYVRHVSSRKIYIEDVGRAVAARREHSDPMSILCCQCARSSSLISHIPQPASAIAMRGRSVIHLIQ